jgi:hypothetical protein
VNPAQLDAAIWAMCHFKYTDPRISDIAISTAMAGFYGHDDEADQRHRLLGCLQHYYSLFLDEMGEEEKKALWSKIQDLTDVL